MAEKLCTLRKYGGGGTQINVEVLVDNQKGNYTTKELNKGDIVTVLLYGNTNSATVSNSTQLQYLPPNIMNGTGIYSVNSKGTVTITGTNNYYKVIRYYL